MINFLTRKAAYIKKKLPIYLVLAVVIFGSFQQNVARALDVDFYSGNDILFYDPSACSVTSQSGDIAVVGNDVAEKVFHFLTTTNFSGFGNKPMNTVQAAGALGNFQIESEMDPSRVENNPPGQYDDKATGDGHGLAQWSYSTNNGVRVGPGRRGTLMDLAQSQGKDWKDLTVQLTMIQNELNGSYGTTLASRGFLTLSDPVAAALLFETVYEGAGTPHQEKRDSAAQAYYAKYKDSTPATTASSSSGSTSSCANAGASGGNYASNFSYFRQFDSPWGQSSTPYGPAMYYACGPTSVAMLVKNMTGQNITPADTIDYVSSHNLWSEGGGGTSFETTVQLAQQWGLSGNIMSQADSKDINAYKKVLDAGGLIIVAGQGALPFVPAPQAHFVIIRALTSSGKFLIADPSPRSASENSQEWDAQAILDSGFGAVSFYKK